jgi:hypothetical protein
MVRCTIHAATEQRVKDFVAKNAVNEAAASGLN